MKEILAGIVPLLRERGFKGSGRNNRKATPDCVLVVNFQKSSGGDRFYVNLGVQPLFVPDAVGHEADPKGIKEYECLFRRRVDPPGDLQGWPCEMPADMTETLRMKLSSAYDEYLHPLAQVPGPMTELAPEGFLRQPEDSILGGARPLNALNFARIALARGDRPRAMRFAELGLSSCPPHAAALRSSLKKVVEQAEPRTR